MHREVPRLRDASRCFHCAPGGTTTRQNNSADAQLHAARVLKVSEYRRKIFSGGIASWSEPAACAAGSVEGWSRHRRRQSRGNDAFEPYCISEITSCDRLLLCLSAEVPACINSCLEVELEVSAA